MLLQENKTPAGYCKQAIHFEILLTPEGKIAAINDLRVPPSYPSEKIKKTDGEFQLTLKRTQDILKAVGERKRDDQVLCGFAMEPSNCWRGRVQNWHPSMPI